MSKPDITASLRIAALALRRLDREAKARRLELVPSERVYVTTSAGTACLNFYDTDPHPGHFALVTLVRDCGADRAPVTTRGAGVEWWAGSFDEGYSYRVEWAASFRGES